MRLKAIKLAGFKSFVDPTTVPFTTNMTGIVGPNGCGKSNTIDAAQVFSRAFAHHPAQRLQKVRLATAIRPDNAGQPIRDDQIGRIDKAFEAIEPEFGKAQSRP